MPWALECACAELSLAVEAVPRLALSAFAALSETEAELVLLAEDICCCCFDRELFVLFE